MNRCAVLLCSLLAALTTPCALADDVETIVFLRHGEKPAKEIGQIDIAGLNRALALPEVLLSRFKNPQFIFAPGTSEKITNKTDNQQFSYLRPLITIEPTAIRAGLPVNTDFGYHHIQELEAELLKDQYKSAMIYVAWEHHMLDELVKKLVADLHGTAMVPEWPREDFDSLFVLTIHRDGAHRTVEFRVDHEGIFPSDTFPTPSATK
jgi:hypothetical protein